MTLFRNRTHADLWRQRWCETCFQPDEAARRIQHKNTECPIWKKAATTDRKPPEWDRMPRADEMVRTIKCNAYQPVPPLRKRRAEQQFEDVPLFDVEPQQTRLVPVEGWPERPMKDGVDHQ